MLPEYQLRILVGDGHFFHFQITSFTYHFALIISGYGATCVALVLSATTILKEKEKLPLPGVLTPGACFAKTSLISNLSKNGFAFEVISVQETE